jgi:hypothetical protein
MPGDRAQLRLTCAARGEDRPEVAVASMRAIAAVDRDGCYAYNHPEATNREAVTEPLAAR